MNPRFENAMLYGLMARVEKLTRQIGRHDISSRRKARIGRQLRHAQAQLLAHRITHSA